MREQRKAQKEALSDNRKAFIFESQLSFFCGSSSVLAVSAREVALLLSWFIKGDM